MRKIKDQNLVNEAIEFSKILKSTLAGNALNQYSDANKIRCVEFIRRGLSLHEASEIFEIPRSTLRGWRFRVESAYSDKPLIAPISRKEDASALDTNTEIDPNHLIEELNINKLVQVHVTGSSVNELATADNIEFKVSSNNLNLSIKNLNLLSAKELMKEYLKCLSMKEI